MRRAALRPMGTLVLKTTCAAEAGFNAAPFVIDELNIVGSRCGPFPPALKLLVSGGLRVEKYITATYPLKDMDRAIEKARTKGTTKVQVVCNDSAINAIMAN